MSKDYHPILRFLINFGFIVEPIKERGEGWFGGIVWGLTSWAIIALLILLIIIGIKAAIYCFSMAF